MAFPTGLLNGGAIYHCSTSLLGIEDAPFLNVLVNLRLGERSIAPEVPAHSHPLVAGQDWIQYVPPVVGAVDIPRTQHGSFSVPELVEAR